MVSEDAEGADLVEQIARIHGIPREELHEQPCHIPGVSPWLTETRRYRCGHSVDDDA